MNDNEIYLWWIVIGSILATYFWRFLGALFSKRIDPKGSIFQWVTCVSYAMLAGLISRMIFMPVGALVEVELWIRVLGITAGIIVYFVFGRIILLSVSAGLATFVGLIAYTH